jgi:hypothetical protein
MEFQFKLSEDDYVSAHLSYLKRYPWRFLWWFRYPVAVAGAAILLALQRPDSRHIAAWLFLIAAGTSAYIVLAFRWDRRQEFRRTLLGQRLISATINGESVSWRGEKSEITANWKDIMHVYESHRGFMFRTAKRKNFFLPKAAMSRLQVEELRSFVSSNAKGKVQSLITLLFDK